MNRKITLLILGATMTLNLIASSGNSNSNKGNKNKHSGENHPVILPVHRPVADIPMTLPSHHRPVGDIPTTLPSHHRPVADIPTILPSHRPVPDWNHDGWYGDDDYYKKNWGYSKDNFRNWLRRHPNLNRKDKKALEKLYKEQLAYERKLRKKFSKYNREITTLPAYRNDRDPMGAFIEDYLYNRDSMRNYRFSDSFRRDMRREDSEAADFFRFIGSFR